MELCEWLDIRIIEGAICSDYVHMCLSVPPKLAPSHVMKILKGKSAERLRNKFSELGKKYWGMHIWARGYFVSTDGIDSSVIERYVKEQVFTGNFSQVLKLILGKKASGLSATNIVRLKKLWEEEYRRWTQRDLSEKRYVYFLADGIYFNARLEDSENDRQCILVIIGAVEGGTKALFATSNGYRESSQGWQ
jgi:hypothetical protein